MPGVGGQQRFVAQVEPPRAGPGSEDRGQPGLPVDQGAVAVKAQRVEVRQFHGGYLWRARKFLFLIMLPHVAMSHQVPRRACERSKNAQRQSGVPHVLSRGQVPRCCASLTTSSNPTSPAVSELSGCAASSTRPAGSTLSCARLPRARARSGASCSGVGGGPPALCASSARRLSLTSRACRNPAGGTAASGPTSPASRSQAAAESALASRSIPVSASQVLT